ncbi:hypothetical protein Syun_002580 [Stephania yunnanensis]|uniref:GDSL esterase/lipase At5g03610-like n=1 Tax=Stephania yunnanensis TaxID=152371 RepID=A0AAP0Q7J7_9MAGN
MEPQKYKHSLICFFFFFAPLVIAGIQVANASSHHHHHHPRGGISKLFVFGDSYADTGNNRKPASSWGVPYGITFPGKPAGRFSDGRVLTDYLASFIGIKSPIPYRWRKYAGHRIRDGLNFAYGGTGVFDTRISPDPNMTTQIDFFQKLIHSNVYSKQDLSSSVALVSLAGNDYSNYIASNGSIQGLPGFIVSVVNQLALNLKRIHDLGVKKVAVIGLQPLGCLPRSTASSSYQRCNGTENMAVGFHNSLLKEAVAKLNTESKSSAFVILDLYKAFTTVFNTSQNHPGSVRFENPLKPCCVGTSPEFSCGSVDFNGVKRYTVCENPELAFFWDGVHPTQQGWFSVYSVLQASLDQIYT